MQGSKGRHHALDEKDAKVLKALRMDARKTTRELASATGLRPSTVNARIHRLMHRGIIERFTIRTNEEALGQGVTGFVFLETNADLPQSFFEQQSILDAFGVTGEYDIILKTRFSTIEQFNRFLLELRKQKAISKTFTVVATVKIKEEL